MRKQISITVSILIFTIFAASIFCCCIKGTAQAQEEQKLSCHQQHESDEQSKHKECDCQELISSTVQNSFVVKLSHKTVSFVDNLLVENSFAATSINTPLSVHNKASPNILSKQIPLFIKHARYLL